MFVSSGINLYDLVLEVGLGGSLRCIRTAFKSKGLSKGFQFLRFRRGQASILGHFYGNCQKLRAFYTQIRVDD